jgi:hypothetical protein
MAKKYQHRPLQDLPKFTQIGILDLKIYHLATLGRDLSPSEIPLKAFSSVKTDHKFRNGRKQGCQMVEYFQTKYFFFGIFRGHCNTNKCGIFCGHLEYFTTIKYVLAIGYILWSFGCWRMQLDPNKTKSDK